MSMTPDADFVADVFIQEGVSPAPGVLIAACTIGDDYDSPKNKIGVRRAGGWLDFGISKEAILSVDADEAGAAYVLGENGSVVAFAWRAPATQAELKASRQAFRNPAVESRGPLRRLRLLGRDVVCAGSVGQAYRLDGGQFHALPVLQVDGQALTIEDLAGSAVSDFIAVTSDGYAAWFDGVRWQTLDLPTNASLTSICEFGGDVAIAGKNGTLVLGNRAQGHWSVVPPLDEKRSYWGVAAFEGVVHVAHLGGIDRLVDGALVPLGIPDAASHEFAVLRSGADGVWSFAGKTIGQVVGDQWRVLVQG
jgi:hypothetical protein